MANPERSGRRRLPWNLNDKLETKKAKQVTIETTNTEKPVSKRFAHAAFQKKHEPDDSEEEPGSEDGSNKLRATRQPPIKKLKVTSPVNVGSVLHSGDYMTKDDEKYRMVEDEFFDIARATAASVHAENWSHFTTPEPGRVHASVRGKRSLSDRRKEEADRLSVLLTSPIKQAVDLTLHLQAPSKIRSASSFIHQSSDNERKEDDQVPTTIKSQKPTEDDVAGSESSTKFGPDCSHSIISVDLPAPAPAINTDLDTDIIPKHSLTLKERQARRSAKIQESHLALNGFWGVNT